MRSEISTLLVRMVTVFLCFAVNPGANAMERGAVTTIAAISAQTSAFIGFESGGVLFCARLSGCKPLEGTPSSAVTAIDISRGGDNKTVWVGYENGSIYFCSLIGGCVLQEQVESGRPAGERSTIDPRKLN